MSLDPQAIGPVPEDTARVARTAFPRGNVYMHMRDELGTFYTDETFAPLFPRNIRFARSDCLACPSRAQCTTSRGGPRNITVRPQAQHLVLQAARQRQRTAEFKAQYDARAGVEGTLGQGLRVSDLRRARYIGLAKTRLQHILMAAALNLRRIGAWLGEVPQAKTRTVPFVALLEGSP